MWGADRLLPALGQFQLYYQLEHDQLEYQPDFVAETETMIYMLEPKAKNEMDDKVVQVKREAALKWCQHASTHAQQYGSKTWKYLLIPHDAISESMNLDGLAAQY